jgi:restriction endonuclease Mrr
VAVPEYNEIKALRAVRRRKIASLGGSFETLAKHFNLTEAEQNEMLPSGTQRRWHKAEQIAYYDLFRAGLGQTQKERHHRAPEESSC